MRTQKTSLILPLVIEVPVSSQESERSCICVQDESILAVSVVCLLDFELLRQCDIFSFSFYYIYTNYITIMRQVKCGSVVSFYL